MRKLEIGKSLISRSATIIDDRDNQLNERASDFSLPTDFSFCKAVLLLLFFWELCAVSSSFFWPYILRLDNHMQP